MHFFEIPHNITHMKDLAQFRKDLAAWMDETGMNQVSLAKASGVDQASLSRFLQTKKKPEGLSGKSILRLYPFVYGQALEMFRDRR